MDRLADLSILAARRAPGLGRCSRGATIAEYAIVAAVVVTAWGAVGSSRFQTVKDDSCASAEAGCQIVAPPPKSAAVAQSIEGRRAAHRIDPKLRKRNLVRGIKPAPTDGTADRRG